MGSCFNGQLGTPDASCLTQYATARGRWLHSAEIKEPLGYREFADSTVHFRLARCLYALCWTGTDRPSMLFDRASIWLVKEEVLLPARPLLSAWSPAFVPGLPVARVNATEPFCTMR